MFQDSQQKTPLIFNDHNKLPDFKMLQAGLLQLIPHQLMSWLFNIRQELALGMRGQGAMLRSGRQDQGP
jgi:hypothetical protein